MWWIPLAIAGGQLLGSKLFGGGPKAPDINAPQYQMGLDFIKPWIKMSQRGLEQQATDWMSGQMRGVRQQSALAGVGGGRSSRDIEAADRLARQAAGEIIVPGMANIYGTAAGLEQQAKIAGMGMYGQNYWDWLKMLQGGQSDWISSLMQLAGTMYSAK